MRQELVKKTLIEIDRCIKQHICDTPFYNIVGFLNVFQEYLTPDLADVMSSEFKYKLFDFVTEKRSINFIPLLRKLYFLGLIKIEDSIQMEILLDSKYALRRVTKIIPQILDDNTDLLIENDRVLYNYKLAYINTPVPKLVSFYKNYSSVPLRDYSVTSDEFNRFLAVFEAIQKRDYETAFKLDDASVETYIEYFFDDVENFKPFLKGKEFYHYNLGIMPLSFYEQYSDLISIITGSLIEHLNDYGIYNRNLVSRTTLDHELSDDAVEVIINKLFQYYYSNNNYPFKEFDLIRWFSLVRPHIFMNDPLKKAFHKLLNDYYRRRLNNPHGPNFEDILIHSIWAALWGDKSMVKRFLFDQNAMVRKLAAFAIKFSTLEEA